MPVVGITGSFGTGKTTVTKFFKRLGARVIDADKIACRILATGTLVYKNIISNFGKEVLKKGLAQIDRHKLAKIVFQNRKFLKKLNCITHPVIIKEIKREIRVIKKSNPRAIIVVDAPLLIEAGLLSLVDKLVVVSANKKIQIFRVKMHKGFSQNDIEARIKAQLPLREKIKSADFVVDNNGSLTYTKKQVREIWEALKKEVE